MSILDLIRAPAKTTDALRGKLAQLQTAEPLAAKPDLMRRRDEALMADDDKLAGKLEAEITQCDRDDRRRELGIETTTRALEQAQRDENQAEVERRVKVAKAATKQTAALLDSYSKHRAEILTILDAISDIDTLITEANNLLPHDQHLPFSEQVARGKPGEPGRELSRKTVDRRWHFADGTRVSDRDIARIRQNDQGEHVVDIIDQSAFTGNSVMDDITGTSHSEDMADYPRRAVRVFLRPVIEVETLDALPALQVQPLITGVSLPEVEVLDTRPPRQKQTRREIGPPVDAAKADTVAA